LNATWHLHDGDFTYYRAEIVSLTVER